MLKNAELMNDCRSPAKKISFIFSSKRKAAAVVPFGRANTPCNSLCEVGKERLISTLLPQAGHHAHFPHAALLRLTGIRNRDGPTDNKNRPTLDTPIETAEFAWGGATMSSEAFPGRAADRVVGVVATGSWCSLDNAALAPCAIFAFIKREEI